MTKLDDIKNLLASHKEQLFKKYGLKFLAVFGSYARNEQTAKSDVDILVEFNSSVGIEFIDLCEELENLLHQKVDLVSKAGVKSKYLQSISSDLIYV